jgi:hypothetical protein
MNLKLWDEDQQRLIGFGELKRLPLITSTPALADSVAE